MPCRQRCDVSWYGDIAQYDIATWLVPMIRSLMTSLSHMSYSCTPTAHSAHSDNQHDMTSLSLSHLCTPTAHHSTLRQLARCDVTVIVVILVYTYSTPQHTQTISTIPSHSCTSNIHGSIRLPSPRDIPQILPHRENLKTGTNLYSWPKPTHQMGDFFRLALTLAPPNTGSRSAASMMLDIPRTTTSLGDRAFAVAGPRVWNSLPPAIRDPSLSPSIFGQLLKTYLFV